MYAKWIAEDVFIQGINVISKGEFRKVHAKQGDKLILSGRNEKGYYGWIPIEKVTIYDTLEKLDIALKG